MTDKSVPLLVRKGTGTYYDDSTDFSDTCDRVRRVPRQHSGWQSITYKGKRYCLRGGFRTPYFICLNNPISTREIANENANIRDPHP